MVPRPLTAGGGIWLGRGGESFLDDQGFALLEGIAATGSITAAGKAAGISYRTAWLAVDRLNALADRPLVERAAGGKRGGGTRLTPHGERLLAVFRAAREEHGRYLASLRAGIGDFDRYLGLARRISLKTSARNQFFGKVVGIRKEGLEAEVILRLEGGARLASRITAQGLENLGLRRGAEAYALIKANWVSLEAPGRGRTRDGMNRLAGRILSLRPGKSAAEAVLELRGGIAVVASVPLRPLRDRGLAEGKAAAAVFAPSDVILGVAG